MGKLQKKESAPLAAGMFGGKPSIPQNAAPPKILIVKDLGKFDAGGQIIDEMVGHILYAQPYNKMYEGEWDENNPQPPVCASSDGVNPDGGDAPCAGPCRTCQNNQFLDDGEGHRVKKCKNKMMVFFLRDGDVMPSLVDLTATSLSDKPDKHGILCWFANAANAANAAGLGPHYQAMRAKLTLEKRTFGRGPASCLVVKCGEVETDEEKLGTLNDMYQHVMESQLSAATYEVMTAATDDDIPV